MNNGLKHEIIMTAGKFPGRKVGFQDKCDKQIPKEIFNWVLIN